MSSIGTVFMISFLYWSQSWRSGTKCDRKTGCGFDPHSRRWNIYLNLYFHFFALVSRLSSALGSATQHAMQNSAESGEQSVLTLGSLCLPCCVRDTAWSWFFLFFFYYGTIELVWWWDWKMADDTLDFVLLQYTAA